MKFFIVWIVPYLHALNIGVGLLLMMQNAEDDWWTAMAGVVLVAAGLVHLIRTVNEYKNL